MFSVRYSYGARKDEVNFFKVLALGQPAQAVASFIKLGDTVLVLGRLQQEKNKNMVIYATDIQKFNVRREADQPV